ncbi:MAG: DUF928 domain-containing protein [Cyanobacteria bacterium P01_F01_bin.143]
MNKQKTSGFRRSLYLSTALVVATLISGNLSSLAEGESSLAEERVAAVGTFSLTTHNHTSPRTNNETEEKPLDFSDTGRSGQQTAGETRRGQCPDVDWPLTALVPSSNSGKTIATHPKLWFYLPYSDQDISKIEFVIQDAKRRDISRQTLTPQDMPGYLTAGLPETEPGLETGKSYRWYLKVYCQDDANIAPLFVQGWIDKVAVREDIAEQPLTEETSVVAAIVDVNELSIDSQEDNSPHMKYAYDELWFDAIDSFLTSYVASPNNSTLKKDWEKLIKAKGADLELPGLETTNFFVNPE